MSLDQLLSVFIEESRTLLRDMEEGLLRLELAPNEPDTLNAVFRAAHTIKGSAGLFGLDVIVSFTHVVENVLDQLRAGGIPADAELSGLLLKCCDHLSDLVEAAASGKGADAADSSTAEALLVRLRLYLGDDGEPRGSLPVEAPAPVEVCGRETPNDCWRIALDFGPDALRNGFDPASFLRYLRTLGDIVRISTRANRMPPAETMDPESCYLGFEIEFKSEADKKTIEDVFEFVRDDCQIHIIPSPDYVASAIERIENLDPRCDKVGEILLEAAAVTPRELNQALEFQSRLADGERPRVGEILVQEAVITDQVVEVALEKQKQVREAKARENQFIRVHAGKLDQLITLVGELVIAGASASLLVQRSNDSALQQSLVTILRMVEDVRASALQLRMVPIGETFGRFNRVVRDVSKELGKAIELKISGAETELDKTVVEKIGDPLLHLVRNAIDHGIEPDQVRLARGKPANGTVHLNAYHESGGIVIEVSDDGGGLNRDKILKKALAKGIVGPHQQLSDQEIYQLIFEPGFSTADQVTNLSGRGVGMDVVKRNIEDLRGSVEIDSREGLGSTLRIRLPLTLAIIDGFLVEVGGIAYVIPLDMVAECLDFTEQEHRQHGGDYLNLRGEVLPLLNLRKHFLMPGIGPSRQNIVVVEFAGHRVGLIVDELLGAFQTVIKPLGKLFDKSLGVSGSTIIGSGKVALILDVPSLIQRATALEAQKLAYEPV
jgi:two-component system chemotaxis sensor kinase CheA